ncbi:divalent-cation tolerance protein CutA [Paracidobacterium acidisoli]|uniref:Divalent-cation tolerance protein CutA n=1 Tax=Paracidobacterium acidisoli TaxID=2303751 RepID=A0A372IKB3_9BACT|nr:divalent-cation tolerance protein CutA [Paracidobacterium acidisoli]MBT9332720.1 divalent-cation tolerance protein CutA [Paracidobacterium acidisoli]
MTVAAADVRIVLSTAGSREEAERIAHTLVEERLAACVNLAPGLTSIYRWQEKIESAEEVLLLIKTSARHLENLEAALKRLHSYEVPELLILRVESGSREYLDWLAGCLRPGI